jgi:Rrf2 family protein
MILLSKRALLGVAAVVDIAIHARPVPVAAKALAARHNLPPRHLETLLQALVRASILKGVRGPKGGYELARERRRITVGEVVRVAIASDEDGAYELQTSSRLVSEIVAPIVSEASKELISVLDQTTIEDLVRRAEGLGGFGAGSSLVDFTI